MFQFFFNQEIPSSKAAKKTDNYKLNRYNAPMSRILVTGSTAYDLLLNSDGSFADGISDQDLDSLSVAFLAQRFARHHGGTGANIAWNLNLLNQNPLLVSTVGSDGGSYCSLMKEKGMDTSRVEILDDHLTATAIVSTDSGERQITFFHPGADQHGSWPDLSQNRDEIDIAIVSPRDTTLMAEAVQWCQEFKVTYFFDPGQMVLAFGSDALGRAIEGSRGLVVNEYEWGLVKDKLGCTEENIQMLTPLLVVTRGEAGVTVFDESGGITVGACTADKVINPTGAGDAFRAGLLTGLKNEWTVEESVQLGSALGSFAVEQEGTLLDSLDIDQVRLRAERAYRKALPEL